MFRKDLQSYPFFKILKLNPLQSISEEKTKGFIKQLLQRDFPIFLCSSILCNFSALLTCKKNVWYFLAIFKVIATGYEIDFLKTFK